VGFTCREGLECPALAEEVVGPARLPMQKPSSQASLIRKLEVKVKVRHYTVAHGEPKQPYFEDCQGNKCCIKGDKFRVI
jgi:hypothetical protein